MKQLALALSLSLFAPAALAGLSAWEADWSKTSQAYRKAQRIPDYPAAANAVNAYVERWRPHLEKTQVFACSQDYVKRTSAQCRDALASEVSQAEDLVARFAVLAAKHAPALHGTKANAARAYAAELRAEARYLPTSEEKAEALRLLIAHDAQVKAFYEAHFPAALDVTFDGFSPLAGDILTSGLWGEALKQHLEFAQKGAKGTLVVRGQADASPPSKGSLLRNTSLSSYGFSMTLELKDAKGSSVLRVPIISRTLGISPENAASSLKRQGAQKVVQHLRDELLERVATGRL